MPCWILGNGCVRPQSQREQIEEPVAQDKASPTGDFLCPACLHFPYPTAAILCISSCLCAHTWVLVKCIVTASHLPLPDLVLSCPSSVPVQAAPSFPLSSLPSLHVDGDGIPRKASEGSGRALEIAQTHKQGQLWRLSPKAFKMPICHGADPGVCFHPPLLGWLTADGFLSGSAQAP